MQGARDAGEEKTQGTWLQGPMEKISQFDFVLAMLLEDIYHFFCFNEGLQELYPACLINIKCILFMSVVITKEEK